MKNDDDDDGEGKERASDLEGRGRYMDDSDSFTLRFLSTKTKARLL